MASVNILEKYGIKEVADVTFYKLGDDGTPTFPVLYLDTLKVSTIEQTAEEATANGGKGNPPLVSWDYGKDITVTLEDALFSAKSMAIMFGNGTVDQFSATSSASGTDGYSLKKTIAWTKTASGSDSTPPTQFEGPDGTKYPIPEDVTAYDATGSSIATGASVSTANYEAGQTYYLTFNMYTSAGVIEISGDTFPGTYYVTGDTYARSATTGNDEFFQFIIPKAKIQSGNTITLEAEGDPSVFNMNLHVLRPAQGPMMKLVKYDFYKANGGAEG